MAAHIQMRSTLALAMIVGFNTAAVDGLGSTVGLVAVASAVVVDLGLTAGLSTAAEDLIG